VGSVTLTGLAGGTSIAAVGDRDLETLLAQGTDVRRRAMRGSQRSANRSAAASVLRLQALAGNAAVSSLMSDGSRVLARSPNTAPTPQSIGEALSKVKVSTTKSSQTMLEPWEIFRLVTANTPRKKSLYKQLHAAWAALRAAGKRRDAPDPRKSKHHRDRKAEAAAVEKARKHVDDVIEQLKKFILEDNDLLRRLRADERTLRSSLKRAKKGLDSLRARKHPDAQKLKESQEAVKTLEEQVAALPRRREQVVADVKERLERTSFSPESVERTTYSIEVEGETVSLSDRVDSWATKFENGLVEADRAVKAKLDDVLAGTSLSESNKKILRAISDNESGGAPWSSVNTYDRAVLTWGLVQWTGGSHSDLTAALTTIKTVAPDAFADRFQKYGIDIVNDQILITGADGSTVAGDDAALKIQGSPTLSAVMSRAGLDSKIQQAEVQASVEQQITGPLRATFEVKGPPGDGKKRLSYGQVLTSELVAGLFADQIVNSGGPKTRAAVAAAVQKFIDAKKLRPGDVDDWAPDLQQRLIELLSPFANRVTSFRKRKCSDQPGTYKF
jgi:hypothetical protein